MKLTKILPSISKKKPDVSETMAKTSTDIKKTFVTSTEKPKIDVSMIPAVNRKAAGKSFVKPVSNVKNTYEKIKEVKKPEIGIFENILNSILKNQEKNIRRYETEKSFREERLNEEQRRHDQLITALKDFTTIRVEKGTAVKEDGSSWFDIFKDYVKSFVEGMLNPFNIIKPFLSVLSAIAKWPVVKWLLKYPTPLALGLALMAYSKEVSPGTLFDKDGNPTNDYRATLVKDKQNFKRPFDSTEPSLVRMIESDDSGANKQKWVSELERGTKVFKDEADALRMKYDIEWPESNIITKETINNMKYVPPKNQTFVPKYSYPDAPKMSEEAARERGRQMITAPFTPSEGRSSSSFVDERLQNFTPMNVEESPVNNAIQENNSLNMETESEPAQNVPPIVNNTNNMSSAPSGGSSTAASIRDETPILERTLRQSTAYV